MNLKVPYIKQLNDHYCGPAALKMVLAFWGTDIDQEDIAKNINADEHGTDRNKLIEAARRYGFDVTSKHHASIEEIQGYIDNKMPVIVNNLDIERKEGHYVVVIGYDEENLIVHDPWFGESQKRNIVDFMSRWNERDNWLLIIKRGL